MFKLSTVSPSATYLITSTPSPSANEGASVTITLQTTGVQYLHQLPFTIEGPGITVADFVGLPSLTGSFIIQRDGTAQITLQLANDVTTEGPEAFDIVLFNGSRIAVTINDTSISPPSGFRYWRMVQLTPTRTNSNGFEWHVNTFNIFATRTDNQQAITALQRSQASRSNITSTALRSGSDLRAIFTDDPFHNAIFATRIAGNWVAVDFGTNVNASSFQYRNSVGSQWAPTRVGLEYSSNGTNWTSAITVNDNGSTVTQTFTL